MELDSVTSTRYDGFSIWTCFSFSVLSCEFCAEDGRKRGSLGGKDKSGNTPKSNAARSFTFRELAVATRGFKEVNLIGEGGFGKVYKGRLESGEAS